MKLAFDIEANGLSEVIINKKGKPEKEGDTIFCICTQDVNTGEKKEFLPGEFDEALEYLNSADLIIGHNIIMYDIPMVERLVGPLKTKAYDTLIVSRLMYPDRQNHPLGNNSLEAWGKHLGSDKLEFHDFSALTNEMVTYCHQDVSITVDIYNAQKSFTSKNMKSEKMEHKIAYILSNQNINGFGFD